MVYPGQFSRHVCIDMNMFFVYSSSDERTKAPSVKKEKETEDPERKKKKDSSLKEERK